MVAPLAFEETFISLDQRLKDLRQTAEENDLGLQKEIKRLEAKSIEILRKAYEHLSPLDIVKIARYPERPHSSDYIEHLIQDFFPLAGDRTFGEDQAIVGGLGRFRGMPVMVLSQEKGKDTDERIRRNFGMPRPEGYRKAERLMRMAAQFNLPVLSFVDTAGAHPGVDAEERGQNQAIASCIETGLNLPVPFIATIIGEGGSGGAVALASANVVLMLQYAIYSVIAPESCAAILWRTSEKADLAAKALKFTAPDLKRLKVIDDIIPEPPGAAHRNALSVIHDTGDAIEKNLKRLLKDKETLREQRFKRFEDIGRQGLRL